VQRAHAHAVASQALASLEPIGDAQTDALIAVVRQRAQAVGAAMGNVCLTNFDVLKEHPHDSESLPRITTCAQLAGRAAPAVTELLASLVELETQTKTRVGLQLPKHVAPCEP
jgi:hypothetical protein